MRGIIGRPDKPGDAILPPRGWSSGSCAVEHRCAADDGAVRRGWQGRDLALFRRSAGLHPAHGDAHAGGACRIAALHRRHAGRRELHAEMVLVRVLDVLRSVPVLEYLSFTVSFFVSILPGQRLGPEQAATLAAKVARKRSTGSEPRDPMAGLCYPSRDQRTNLLRSISSQKNGLALTASAFRLAGRV